MIRASIDSARGLTRLAVATATATAAALGLGACAGASSAPGPPSLPAGSTTITAATAGPVTISPLPGTPDASPQTQISFLGGPGTKVADVEVVGSRSGVHQGKLRAYSTGTGESFLPAHPFREGERVTVHALVGTKTPDEHVSTTFTVADQYAVSKKEFPINQGEPKAIQHYRSAPTLTPSTVTITTPARSGATPGDFFLAPYQGSGSPGPMIVDQQGNLVWFHPLPREYESTNFHVQEYEGKPVLTWWQGRILGVGFGQGEDEIYNTSYQHVATIHAGNGYQADLHEIRLTPEGTAWIDIFDPVRMNLSPYHGESNGVISDSVIEEIDIKTGLVMWEWHALGHIDPADSESPAPTSGSNPWDFVHINTISLGSSGEAVGPGNLLLSSRSMWTLYDVNLRTGNIQWRLGGGKQSSFKLGPGVKFYWQHDAELQPGGLISLFDNGSTPPHEKQSRGLILKPDPARHTVSLVKAFTNPTKTLLATSQGDMLNLSVAPGTGAGTGTATGTEGNWLMGYGGLPNFTEYDHKGEVLFDATLGKNVQDFRTYLAPWSGEPTTSPSIAAQKSSSGSITVEASWNGATQVSSWQILAGSSSSSLTPVTTVSKNGFQTTATISSAGPDVAVKALGSSGQTLATSATVPAS